MMPRIVHFGIGNFHRAHLAWYTWMAGGWAITGVSLRSAGMRDLLAPQGFGYTLVIKDAGGTAQHWIDCIDNVLVGPENGAQIIAAIAAPDTHVVSFTITEKGYHLGANGQLDLSHPGVTADLAGGEQTVYGFLAKGLTARRDAGAGPVTLVSCDNLSNNGATLHRALTAFCTHAAPDLLPWIAANVSCPGTMVDRITPHTTDALIAEVAATGRTDAAPVATEAFTDWVIENRFAGPYPDWQSAGARFVDDVAPYELRKLRLLNGAHSYLAYAGTLAGFEYVHEAIADPALLAGARAIMAEAAQTLPDTVQADAPAYADALIARFANPALHHKLRQIAMDGTQKLPQRLAATWADRQAAGLPAPGVAAGIGAWVAFVRSETKGGRTLDDPRAADLIKAAQSDTPVAAILAVAGLPTELAHQIKG